MSKFKYAHEAAVYAANITNSLPEQTRNNIIEFVKDQNILLNERWDEIRFRIFPKTDKPGEIEGYNAKQRQLAEEASASRKIYIDIINQYIQQQTNFDIEDCEYIRRHIAILIKG